MSIVKMKRLRLLSLASQREELLARLQHAGCVEVLEPEQALTDPEWTALLTRESTSLLTVKSQATAIRAALDTLKRYAPEKTGLFIQRQAIREKDFFRPEALEKALALAEEINERARQISKLHTRETNLLNQKTSLEPWAPLDLPLEVQETATTVVQLGTCPVGVDLAETERQLAETTERSQLMEISRDKHQRYLLLVCWKEEFEEAIKVLRARGYGAARLKGLTGTPMENIQRIEEEIVQVQQERADIIEKIDIGGISLIRAGAKNFKDVVIVPSKAEYGPLLDLLNRKGAQTDVEDRRWFATRAFGVSSHYDTAIHAYFDGGK